MNENIIYYHNKYIPYFTELSSLVPWWLALCVCKMTTLGIIT